MKKEQIMDFTRRISQSNRGGLVIVIYDIFFAYMEDTKEAHDNGEWENYKTALRNASKTISELISSLFPMNLQESYIASMYFAGRHLQKQCIKGI